MARFSLQTWQRTLADNGFWQPMKQIVHPSAAQCNNVQQVTVAVRRQVGLCRFSMDGNFHLRTGAGHA
jgi:hypothetical protein